MQNFLELSEDYRRIEQALSYLEDNVHHQPSLKELAEHLHLSEFHFQRLFTRWVGISPKRFLQFLTKENAKRMLDESGSVLEAAIQTGLSSPGRLHDLLLACEAITPGQYKTRGEGLEIVYGIHPSPFGDCLLAMTARGVCSLSFLAEDNRAAALQKLHNRWQKANLREDQNETRPIISRIFSPKYGLGKKGISVYLSGTNFQIQVWEALLRIPPGQVVSYQDIARHIGKPSAGRAVGQAVALNPVMFLIPCHRVIRRIGEFGSYQGGSVRKKAILGWEMARQSIEPAESNS